MSVAHLCCWVLASLPPLWGKVQYCSALVMQLRLWVPSPLVGEGQDEGATVRSSCLSRDTLSLALSHQGRGDPHVYGSV
jgi:hypothetical protein